ncbi:DUF2165 family protein [Pleomorphovibrio marinus]|uniref:DUF2165 family protein n=1 Tax=Pleomorphovibrio marinus TaxID=2164132 RepID=UPI000E09F0B9
MLVVTTIGLFGGLIFFGFVVLGAEWFGMWQPTGWKGKDGGVQISILLWKDKYESSLPGQQSGHDEHITHWDDYRLRDSIWTLKNKL